MPYTIQIGESQRQIIMTALVVLVGTPDMGDAKLAGISPVEDDNTTRESLMDLVSMFDALPADEDESPGTLHGFCL